MCQYNLFLYIHFNLCGSGSIASAFWCYNALRTGEMSINQKSIKSEMLKRFFHFQISFVSRYEELSDK